MPDLADGETAEVKGSARTPYILKNVGGVYSCTCPAWRNQSLPIERRTCKHLRSFRGEEVGRGAVFLSPRESLPRAGLVRRRLAGCAARRRVVARSAGLSADRQHRAPA